MNKIKELDDVDRSIIQLLYRDARQSSEELAKQLKVSSATVRRRLKNILEEGVIHIAAIPDPRKVGYPLITLIAFDVEQDKLDVAMKTLSNLKQIKWVMSTTGRFDIMCIAWFRSTDELAKFLQEVVKNDGIKDSETFLCLNMLWSGA